MRYGFRKQFSYYLFLFPMFFLSLTFISWDACEIFTRPTNDQRLQMFSGLHCVWPCSSRLSRLNQIEVYLLKRGHNIPNARFFRSWFGTFFPHKLEVSKIHCETAHDHFARGRECALKNLLLLCLTWFKIETSFLQWCVFVFLQYFPFLLVVKVLLVVRTLKRRIHEC